MQTRMPLVPNDPVARQFPTSRAPVAGDEAKEDAKQSVAYEFSRVMRALTADPARQMSDDSAEAAADDGELRGEPRQDEDTARAGTQEEAPELSLAISGRGISIAAWKVSGTPAESVLPLTRPGQAAGLPYSDLDEEAADQSDPAPDEQSAAPSVPAVPRRRPVDALPVTEGDREPPPADAVANPLERVDDPVAANRNVDGHPAAPARSSRPAPAATIDAAVLREADVAEGLSERGTQAVEPEGHAVAARGPTVAPEKAANSDLRHRGAEDDIAAGASEAVAVRDAVPRSDESVLPAPPVTEAPAASTVDGRGMRSGDETSEIRRTIPGQHLPRAVATGSRIGNDVEPEPVREAASQAANRSAQIRQGLDLVQPNGRLIQDGPAGARPDPTLSRAEQAGPNEDGKIAAGAARKRPAPAGPATGRMVPQRDTVRVELVSLQTHLQPGAGAPQQAALVGEVVSEALQEVVSAQPAPAFETDANPARGGVSRHMEIELHPRELGTVKVVMTNREGVVSIEIIATTDKAHELLTSERDILAHTIRQAGSAPGDVTIRLSFDNAAGREFAASANPQQGGSASSDPNARNGAQRQAPASEYRDGEHFPRSGRHGDGEDGLPARHGVYL